MPIAYDATREALLHPALRPTLFGREIPDASRLEAVCAECSRLAYLRFEMPGSASQKDQLAEALAAVGISALACFSDDATSTEAFAAVLPGGGSLVAFRGTEPDQAADLATDLDTIREPWPSGGQVHAGFLHAFSRIDKAVTEWLQAHPKGAGPLVVTGHSLGAALATLAAAAWKADRLITFGSPRVGDADFVSRLAGVRVQRYVDCCDIVTRVPPMLRGLFVDTRDGLYIDRAGKLLPAGWDEPVIEADRAAARERYLLDSTWVRGNVIARDLADHAPINYLRAFVNGPA